MNVGIKNASGQLVKTPKRKTLDGDRGAIARLTILILMAALLIAMFASLTTGSSDASAVS